MNQRRSYGAATVAEVLAGAWFHGIVLRLASTAPGNSRGGKYRWTVPRWVPFGCRLPGHLGTTKPQRPQPSVRGFATPCLCKVCAMHPPLPVSKTHTLTHRHYKDKRPKVLWRVIATTSYGI